MELNINTDKSETLNPVDVIEEQIEFCNLTPSEPPASKEEKKEENETKQKKNLAHQLFNREFRTIANGKLVNVDVTMIFDTEKLLTFDTLCISNTEEEYTITIGATGTLDSVKITHKKGVYNGTSIESSCFNSVLKCTDAVVEGDLKHFKFISDSDAVIISVTPTVCDVCKKKTDDIKPVNFMCCKDCVDNKGFKIFDNRQKESDRFEREESPERYHRHDRCSRENREVPNKQHGYSIEALTGLIVVLSNSQRDINKKLEDLTTEVQKIKKQNPDLNEMD